jgi:hypothetical protein
MGGKLARRAVARLKEGGLYHCSAKFAPAGALNLQLIFRQPFERKKSVRTRAFMGKKSPAAPILSKRRATFDAV